MDKYTEEYIDSLERALMKALDELASRDKDKFDYYEMLCKISNWSNSVALDFLDRLGSDSKESEVSINEIL